MKKTDSPEVFRDLEVEEIGLTAERLRQRIVERFPGSGLGKVAQQVSSICAEVQGVASSLGRPILVLRVGIGFLLVAVFSVCLNRIASMNMSMRVERVSEFLQALESGLNDVILISAGIFFLFTTETRLKRNRVLKILHQLRALAHVVDMHQLTKDPDRVSVVYSKTPSSPDNEMSAAQMGRYLDYCSELLSVIGKVSAFSVQSFYDPAAISAADDVESLSTGLSQKIWQKIMILQSRVGV